jgi:hypothetical protein
MDIDQDTNTSESRKPKLGDIISAVIIAFHFLRRLLYSGTGGFYDTQKMTKILAGRMIRMLHAFDAATGGERPLHPTC